MQMKNILEKFAIGKLDILNMFGFVMCLLMNFLNDFNFVE